MSKHHGPRIVTDGLILYLDSTIQKSYPSSISYGPELVTDASVLTAGDGQKKTISSLGGNYIGFSNICSCVSGKRYKMVWTISAQRGTMSTSFSSSAAPYNTTPSMQGQMNLPPGTYSRTFTSNVNGTFTISADNVGADFDIDYLSIKEILTPNSDLWYDLSGNNYTFNIGGGVYDNGALLYNGGLSNAYESSNNLVPTNYTQWTMECFCKPTSLIDSLSCAGVFNSTLFCKGGSNGDIYSGYFIIFTNNGTTLSTNLTAGVGNNISINTLYNKPVNTPLHIVYQYFYDQSYNTSYTYLYVDSVLCGANLSLGNGPLNNPTEQFRIAGRQNHCPNSSFIGYFYCFRYYNRLLSQAEIKQNFNAGKLKYGYSI